MDCNYIRDKASDVLIECNTKQFPIDCFHILRHYGYKIYTYSELQKKDKSLHDLCISYSDDAFRIGKMKLIAYNEKKPRVRIRFSLIHELGHHILEHKNDSNENEAEANYFASNLLAPRIAMYYAKLKAVSSVAELFEISASAAYYAAQDFSEWCQDICQVGMHSYDKNLYSQFYNADHDGFVYSIKNCEYCGKVLYNSHSDHCKTCCVPEIDNSQIYSHQAPLHNIDMNLFRRLENNWLYSGL